MVEDRRLLRTLRAVGEQVGRVVERRQAQEELRVAKEEAEQANESKRTSAWAPSRTTTRP